MMLARFRTYGSLVAFSHTIFAMPFAASALVLAARVPHVPLTWRRVVAMLGCMVSARTSAMAFNRLVDREIDARNPRTMSREIPSGRVSPREAAALAVLSALVFVVLAATLGSWPARLAPLVVLVLLGYSYAKRFTWASHVWLGVALALAPGGAWIAMGARPSFGILALMMAVGTWLFGFDILYALQDITFDQAHRLRSIPARFGVRLALRASLWAHFLTTGALALTGIFLKCGALYYAGVGAVAALLACEHDLVRRYGLARINKAFFDVNAWISIGFFAVTALDAFIR